MALRRQVKNFVKNYSEAEIKVREATSNDPWGPSSSLMLDISDLTFNTVSLSEIMSMLWQRLNDHGKNWRHVYKSLTLMDYLIKNGSKKVIQLCREGFFNIQSLKDFHHIDEAGKDQESTSKTELRPEQSYCIHMPSRSAVSQETLPLKMNVWKSAEDLMVFYDEEPKQLLPPAPAVIPPPSLVMEECEEGYSLWDSDAVPAPLERSPSLHTNLSLGKRLDSSGIGRFDLSNLALENTMQQSLECHSPQKNCDALGTVQGLWPSGREEAVNTNIRVSKSDPFFHRSQASVETLYVSPSFKTFEPLKENSISKEYPKPMQSPSKQFSENNTPLPNLSTDSIKMDGMGLNPFARRDSTISEGTSSSFSTFSMSSPDLATPESILYPLGRPSGGPFLRPSSHGPSSSSVLFKDMQVRVNHPFAPCPASSDEDDSDAINLLDIHPDNSTSADHRTLSAARGNWITFPIQDMQCLTSASDPTSLASKRLPETTGTNTPIMAELVEIKNALRRLHGDLSAVVQELRIVNSHLVSMEARSSPQVPQPVGKPLPPGASPSTCGPSRSDLPKDDGHASPSASRKVLEGGLCGFLVPAAGSGWQFLFFFYIY
uniref:ENTH domain-containing protein 1 isoform X2 n=1 Tax=Phascolarctos cinereus TaxID=38626 RepID=A0A6P5JZR2_PHACI|nr:ENTH domain-containing protein 1 isoform X2 [Phascolarctos cinereus]